MSIPASRRLQCARSLSRSLCASERCWLQGSKVLSCICAMSAPQLSCTQLRASFSNSTLPKRQVRGYRQKDATLTLMPHDSLASVCTEPFCLLQLLCIQAPAKVTHTLAKLQHSLYMATKCRDAQPCDRCICRTEDAARAKELLFASPALAAPTFESILGTDPVNIPVRMDAYVSYIACRVFDILRSSSEVRDHCFRS